MSGDSNETYEVGYGKPPMVTRFQKGRSGNPSGRPKKTPERDTGKILQLLDNEEINVTVDGRRKYMLKAEIQFRRLFAHAIKGDLAAARLIAKMAARYFGPEAKGPSETLFKVMPDEYFKQKDRAEARKDP